MTNVGIEAITFDTSPYYLDLAVLAEARGIDPDKYRIGLGQEKMAVPPPGLDIVTMGANAAARALSQVDANAIDTLLFATESGIDQSKSAGLYLHRLLHLPSACRVLELKQACYSATGGLQLALAWVQRHPDRKVLIVASDIARYGLGTPGEPTQGCGAVAMVISANPRIAIIEPEYGVYAEEVMDFWRPNYRDEALVDGKYSTRMYIHALCETWARYAGVSGRRFDDHVRFCYHLPFTRMAEKAHARLAKAAGGGELTAQRLEQHIGDSLFYNRVCGNSYAASLYIGFCSMLDRTTEECAGQRAGFFSYGSGCVAEFFSGVVQPGYRDALQTEAHENLLANRESLAYTVYEEWYRFALPQTGDAFEAPVFRTGRYRLAGVRDHKRLYCEVTS